MGSNWRPSGEKVFHVLKQVRLLQKALVGVEKLALSWVIWIGYTVKTKAGHAWLVSMLFSQQKTLPWPSWLLSNLLRQNGVELDVLHYRVWRSVERSSQSVYQILPSRQHLCPSTLRTQICPQDAPRSARQARGFPTDHEAVSYVFNSSSSLTSSWISLIS